MFFGGPVPTWADIPLEIAKPQAGRIDQCPPWKSSLSGQDREGGESPGEGGAEAVETWRSAWVFLRIPGLWKQHDPRPANHCPASVLGWTQPVYSPRNGAPGGLLSAAADQKVPRPGGLIGHQAPTPGCSPMLQVNGPSELTSHSPGNCAA